MRDALRKDLFKLDSKFESEGSDSDEGASAQADSQGDSIVRRRGDTWHVKPCEIVYLTTSVCNMTGTLCL